MGTFKEEKGFALIITISLMAFLVLLLVSLTTMTRVETQLASNSQQVQNARENARMALNVAVAQLQRYAGPDFVNTARADIDPLNGNDNNKYWTGIWDAGTLQTWLVSGNHPADPEAFKPSDNNDAELQGQYYDDTNMVRLVDTGSGDWDGTNMNGAVVAPRVPLYAPNYPGIPGVVSIVGHYAYWVGDQGVKASVAKTERHRDVDFGTGNTAGVEFEQQILRQLMPQRFGHHPLFSNMDEIEIASPTAVDYKRHLGQVQSLHQMRVAANPPATTPPTPDYLDFNTPARDALKSHFHDITHFNMGVLASAVGPGLKQDLSSYVGGWPPGAGGLPGVTEYMSAAVQSGPIAFPATGIESNMEAPTPAAPGAGQPAFKVAPVISEVLFIYSVGVGAGRQLELELEVEVELWNPYNVTLKGGDLFLRLDNLPPITVIHNGDPLDDEIDLAATFALAMVNYTFSPTDMLPGSIHTETLPSGIPVTALDYSTPPLPIVLPPPDPGPPAQDEWSLEASFPNLEVEFYLGASEAGGLLLSRFTSNHFESYTMEPITVTNDPPEPRFGFYLRMRDANDDADWLTYYNPAATGLDDGDDATAASADDPFETEPDVEAATTRAFSTSGDLLGQLNTVILFDLPTQDVVSLGSLQHLYVHDRPTYSLGNPWGGPINGIFDTHFISTVPPTVTLDPAMFPLPHTGMIPYQGNGNEPYTAPAGEDFGSVESSRHLLLKGMFNINSTSIDAWRSVLSALTIVADANTGDPDWEYSDGNESTDLWNAFFRFSQTGDTLSTYTENQAQLGNLNVAYRQGVRELEDPEITLLATDIVDAIRARATPFETLQQFVNSGIVRDAIANVSSINSGIPVLSPAYLTQGDIITALAPFMLARSDTFLVRAYGDAMNPATGQREGRAWCEAIVQRVPTPFDPTGDIVDPSLDPTPFGRKFEIIYFRWLDSSEL